MTTAFNSLNRSYLSNFKIFTRIFWLLILSASLLLNVSCKTSKKIKSTSGHPHVENIHIHKGNKVQREILEEANKWLGTPYKYAASRKGVGTDCSGMVLKVYESVIGELLPRNSAKQAEYCIPINSDEVQLGDLVFFATGKDPNKISHVGIIIDEDNFIHASSSKGVVISSLSSNYYQRTFKQFGRTPGMMNNSTIRKSTNKKNKKTNG
ncbi:MAG: C40 family peptidase [Bacteroidales bacterium]|nr:C40 family peptidase [Bacteroidales bacterium]MBD5206528.1 C40 family peptidase [Bacteroidales bacterium]MBD5301834.1 C40 family peptidase [Bacteroides sp.]